MKIVCVFVYEVRVYMYMCVFVYEDRVYILYVCLCVNIVCVCVLDSKLTDALNNAPHCLIGRCE